MASVIDQLPRFAATCRKAAAAARENPAATPAYWQILRAVTQQILPFLGRSILDGCTFPDRPVHLDADVACLLDFGTTPAVLAADIAQGRDEPLPPEDEQRQAGLLRRLAASWAADHRETLVYNFAEWIQEQYRDCLDIDYAESLQRELDECKQRMDDVPRHLQSIGLSPTMAEQVMEAFNLFRKITAASYQLERSKSSFTDRRGFASVRGQIENTLVRATEDLGRGGGGRAQVRELFAGWKNASYEAMLLTNKLRGVWAGTQLDERIQELARLAQAVFHALVVKCPEGADDPRPVCLLPLAEDIPDVLDRAAVRRAFEDVLDQDVIGAGDDAAEYRELRRFGPFAVIITPGTGRVRYVEGLRTARAVPGEEDIRKSQPTIAVDERGVDIIRRLRYPINCFVVPHRADAATLDRQFVAAWFEYSVLARAKATKDAIESCRDAVPGVFDPPAGSTSAGVFARDRFVDLVTAYVRWRRDGSPPPPEADLPFEPFLAWARARGPRPAFLTPRRYRGPVAAFRAMSRRRRDEAWRRAMGPGYALDRELIALQLARKDFPAFFEALALLPPDQRRGAALDRARQDMDGQDTFGDRDRKIEASLRRFMEENPDLRAAAVAMDTAIAIEIETRRAQSESLGRKFNFDEAGESILQSLLSDLMARRHRIAEHGDGVLIGLYHAVEGNDAAAVRAFVDCLEAPDGARTGTRAVSTGTAAVAPDAEETVDAAWFAKRFAPVSGTFPKRRVPGVDVMEPPDRDFIYYNLGQLYRRLGRPLEASLCLAEFRRQASSTGRHGYAVLADEILAELRPERRAAEAEEARLRETVAMDTTSMAGD